MASYFDDHARDDSERRSSEGDGDADDVFYNLARAMGVMPSEYASLV